MKSFTQTSMRAAGAIATFVGMMVLVLWFTYLGLREARKNDELIAQGREEDILRDMQE